MSFSTMMIVDSALMQPRVIPNTKSIEQFYIDLANEIQSIRSAIPDAENDPAFKKAVDIFDTAIPPCQNFESISVKAAGKAMSDWSAAMEKVGKDSLPEVQGKPSKLLAEKFSQLLEDMMNKKYWPKGTSPRLLSLGLFSVGPCFDTVYALNFTRRLPGLAKSIDILKSRISEYDEKSEVLSMKLK